MISSQPHAHRNLGWKQCIYQHPSPPSHTTSPTWDLPYHTRDAAVPLRPTGLLHLQPPHADRPLFPTQQCTPTFFLQETAGRRAGKLPPWLGCSYPAGFFFLPHPIPVNCVCLSIGITSVSFKPPGSPSLSSQQYNFKTWAPTWGQSLASQRPKGPCPVWGAA